LESLVQRFRCGEVAGDDLGALRQRRAFWPARERAHGSAGTQKLVDDKAPDAAGGACHENGIRARQ
jgi:hypothetical protein